jgi:hypothetical protein
MVTHRHVGLVIALAVGCSLEGFTGGGNATSAAGGANAGGASTAAPSSATGQGSASGGSGGSGGASCGCRCAAWQEHVISTAGNAVEPSLSWAGDHWAVAWQDDRDGNAEIYFARIHANDG